MDGCGGDAFSGDEAGNHLSRLLFLPLCAIAGDLSGFRNFPQRRVLPFAYGLLFDSAAPLSIKKHLQQALRGAYLRRRFRSMRSFRAIALKHSLHGALIFRIGLGRFFFTGAANL
jgi:hypothetical protein